MSVRNGLWCTLSVAVLTLLVVAIGCETVEEHNYYANVEESGLSTGQVTGVPGIMQQMRTANLKLVDSLIYMNGDGIMKNSVEMHKLALDLQQTQPAVAMQAPDDVGKFKKLADQLAETIAKVGGAAMNNRIDWADEYYAQAFPLCNRCHVQFRNVPTHQPLTIPELEQPASAAPVGGGVELAPLPAAGTE